MPDKITRRGRTPSPDVLRARGHAAVGVHPAPQAIQKLWDVFTEWFPSNSYRTRTGPEILRTRLSPEKTETDTDTELGLLVEPEHN